MSCVPPASGKGCWRTGTALECSSGAAASIRKLNGGLLVMHAAVSDSQSRLGRPGWVLRGPAPTSNNPQSMPKVTPVTEVTSASQIAELRWYEQGDAQLQTKEMLAIRAGLRCDKVVLQELNTWWEAALTGSFAAAKAAGVDTSYEDKVDNDGRTTGINRHRYCAISNTLRHDPQL